VNSTIESRDGCQVARDRQNRAQQQEQVPLDYELETPAPVTIDIPLQPVSSRSELESQDRLVDSSTVPRKRRRVDSCGNPNIEVMESLTGVERIAIDLPPPVLLEEIITAHFTNVQPWLPVIHETQFRKNLCDKSQHKRLIVVLYAMVFASIRLVDTRNHPLSLAELDHWTARSRDAVLLRAMNQLSVENLQALSILAFVDVRMLRIVCS
jgi:hypothetical protein